MPVTTRFAPSPTGRLHVGNLRTALLNRLLARHLDGRFLLRIDDTDRERSREEHIAAIRDDLAWLGIAPDGEVRQSARSDLYEHEAARLVDAGRLYPCWESTRELELKRKVLLGRGLPPVYDRGALALTEAEKRARLADGDAPHWRFKLDHAAPIVWRDGVRGEQRFDAAMISDPVVRRADGSWLYLLPSVIDDVDMGISDVLRGEDHVSNTAVQLQMFAALGAPAPRFAHVALLTGGEGKLSKRLGSLGVAELRGDGVEPEALLALLARLGTADPVDPALGEGELAASLDLARFGRAPARFDEAELARVNAAVVHRLPFARVRSRLPGAIDAAMWDAVRPNLERVSDAKGWSAVIAGPITPPAVDDDTRTYLTQAVRIFREQRWDRADPWHALTAMLAERTGRKGKALFQPLRLALTGCGSGPDMAALLPLIGRESALARLEAAAGGDAASPPIALP